MARFAIPLTVLAAALAGCGTYEQPRTAAVVTSSGAPVIASGAVVSGTPVAPAPATVVAAPAVVGQPILIASGPVQPGTPIAPQGTTFRPGNGTIESVAALHITPYAGASAGASAPERLAYRLTVKMDDGTMQAVDQDNRSFAVGDRIQIGADGRVTRQ